MSARAIKLTDQTQRERGNSMSGATYETFGEFFDRRCRELVEEADKSVQLERRLSKMSVSGLVKMIEDEWDEYCYCADDLMPPSASRDYRGGSLLQ